MAGRREVYQTAMREGHALAWSLKWEAAIQKYRLALLEFPDDAAAHVSTGVALARLGRHREALASYEAARKERANDTAVLLRVAELRQQCGDRLGAAAAFAELGELCQAQGDPEKAGDAWQRILDLETGDLGVLSRARRGALALGRADLVAEIDTLLAPLLPASSPLPTHRPSEEGGATGKEERDASPISPPTSYLSGVEGEGATSTDSDIVPSPVLALFSQLLEALENEVAEPSGSQRAAEMWQQFVAACPDWLLGRYDDLREMPSDTRSAVLRSLLRVRVFQEQGQWSAALDECYRAIGLAPSYLPAQLRLAELLKACGQGELGIKTVTAAADLYELRGDPAGAVVILQMQAAAEPENLELQARLASALETAPTVPGSYDEAVQQYVRTAERYLVREQPDRAVDLFRSALRLAPTHPEMALRTGALLEGRGRLAEALEVYRTARAAHPQHPLLTVSWLTTLAATRHQIDLEALEAVLAAVEGGAEPRPHVLDRLQHSAANDPTNLELQYVLGRALLAAGSGETDDPLAPLLEASGLSGAFGSEAGYLAAELLLAQGEVNRAAEVLQRALLGLEGCEDEVELADKVARLLLDVQQRRGDILGAVTALEVLRRLNPDDDNVYPQLAGGYFRLGRLDEAVVAFSVLAEIYERRGATEQAIGVYRGIVQLRPDHGLARMKLADDAQARGMFDDAAAELAELAETCLRLGRTDEAIQALRRQLSIWHGRDARRALAVREQLARLVPDDVTVRLDLLAAYLQLGQASRVLTEGRAFADDLVRGERYADAAQVLTDVLRLDPWNHALLEQLGSLHARLGHIDEATGYYERLLALAPPEPLQKSVSEALAALQAKAHNAAVAPNANVEEAPVVAGAGEPAGSSWSPGGSDGAAS